MPKYATSVADAPDVYIFDRGSTSDYTNILVHGMASGIDVDTRTFRYLRCGPFVPPVSCLRGVFIVSSQGKLALEARLPDTIRYERLVIEKFVRIDWDPDDDDQDVPMPSEVIHEELDDDPEDYVLEGTDDPDLRQECGPLWRVIPFNAQGRGVPADIPLFVSGEDSYDIMQTYCNDHGRDIMQAVGGRFVEFYRVRPPKAFFENCSS